MKLPQPNLKGGKRVRGERIEKCSKGLRKREESWEGQQVIGRFIWADHCRVSVLCEVAGTQGHISEHSY